MGGIPIRLGIAFLLAALPLAGVEAQTPEKRDVIIAIGGISSQIDKLPYAIARHRGYFKDEGLDAQFLDFGSGAKGLQAMIGGSADVTQGAYEHTVRMQAKGQDLQSFVAFARYPGNVLAVVKARSGAVKKPEDFKGLKVGVTSPGSASHAFFGKYMQNAGLDPKQVSYIAVGAGPGAVAAVRRGGELDAIVSLDPVITELERSDDITIIADSRTKEGTHQVYGGDFIAGSLYAKAEFVKKNPNTVQAMANAMIRAMKWMETASVDDVIASVPEEYYRANEAAYRQAVERNLTAFRFDGRITAENVQTVLESIAVLEPELKAAPLDLSKTYTNEFVDRAHAKFK